MATGQTDDYELLPLLLEVCEDLLSHAGPATHTELDLLLRKRAITGGPGWLIDMLALTRHRLQHQRDTGTPEDNKIKI